MAFYIHDLPSGNCIGNEAVAVTSTTAEVHLTESVYAPSGRGADAAYLQIATDAIDFTIDGTDPNAGGAGVIRCAAGDVIKLHGAEQIRGFRAVKVTSNATVNAVYFRGGCM
jgi:hypothetical protein